jgi:hypothetical protein
VLGGDKSGNKTNDFEGGLGNAFRVDQRLDSASGGCRFLIEIG